MTGIEYISNGKSIEFGPHGKRPAKGNSFEYQKYLYMIGLIKDQINERKLIVIGENCLEQRFFGTGTNALLREKPAILGFPDMAVIRDEVVVCIEHFCINASRPLQKNNKNHGSSYDRFLGQHGDEIASNNLKQLAKQLCNEKIEFSNEYLVSNLRESILRKTSKIPRYVTATKEHIASKDPHTARIDLDKTFEVWFFVEDITPILPELEFPFSRPEIYNLLSNNQQIAGIIYFQSPNPSEPNRSIERIAFIHNDETAIEVLRSWSLWSK